MKKKNAPNLAKHTADAADVSAAKRINAKQIFVFKTNKNFHFSVRTYYRVIYYMILYMSLLLTFYTRFGIFTWWINKKKKKPIRCGQQNFWRRYDVATVERNPFNTDPRLLEKPDVLSHSRWYYNNRLSTKRRVLRADFYKTRGTVRLRSCKRDTYCQHQSRSMRICRTAWSARFH